MLHRDRLVDPWMAWTSILVVGAVVWAPAAARPEDAGDFAIDRAVERGVRFLLGRAGSQMVGSHGPGQTALETYALVAAGVSVDHPTIERNLQYLDRELGASTHTYSLACYAFALDAAIAQIEEDRDLPRARAAGAAPPPVVRVGDLRSLVRSVVRRLVKSRNAGGTWRYNEGAADFDNSNVQFAVLALGVGAKRGVAIDRDVWEGIVRHFADGQQKDGAPIDAATEEDRGPRGRTAVADSSPTRQRGWDYQSGGGSNWNMTCAGVSSLLLARDALGDRIDPVLGVRLNAAIRDGNGWLMGNWRPSGSYYGMYSLEKVADIGGIRTFSGRDWYREISTHLVKSQQADGAWRNGNGPGENDDRVTTSFALLVLARASRLVNQVIYTGGAGPSSADDRTWVFVSRLSKLVHYPTLLRAIRGRPSVRLARLVDDIVENQPAELRGDMVPSLLLTLEAVGDVTVRGVIEEALGKITGLRESDPKRYAEWHDRWRSIDALAGKKDRKTVDTLLEMYGQAGTSLPLKQKIAGLFLRSRIRGGIGRVFRDLESEDPGVREWAHRTLQSFYLEKLPAFDPDGDAGRRQAQADAIRKWILVKERALEDEKAEP